MQARLERAGKDLANGPRHRAILGNVVQLVRLTKEGHIGLPRALESLAADFVLRVADDRGGRPVAEAEWKRALDGALAKVLGGTGVLPRFPACDCFILRLREATADPRLFSRGIQGLTERRVLDSLHRAARLARAQYVRESQRQIAEDIGSSQKTVSHAMGPPRGPRVGPGVRRSGFPAANTGTTAGAGGVHEGITRTTRGLGSRETRRVVRVIPRCTLAAITCSEPKALARESRRPSPLSQSRSLAPCGAGTGASADWFALARAANQATGCSTPGKGSGRCRQRLAAAGGR